MAQIMKGEIFYFRIVSCSCKVTVNIFTVRPGMVIGRKGAEVYIPRLSIFGRMVRK